MENGTLVFGLSDRKSKSIGKGTETAVWSVQTEFQRIDVFDSDEFGRFLSL